MSVPGGGVAVDQSSELIAKGLVLVIGLAVLNEHGSACREVGEQHRWGELKC